MLDIFGAAVATVGITAILCVFTFGLHPSEFMLDLMDEINARREERDEALNQRREQRMARREAMRANPNANVSMTEEQRRDKRRKRRNLL